MTTEEAINEVKKAMPTMWKETKEALSILIPELAESEDERLIKAAVWYLEHATERCAANYNGITPKQIITYLEKQKPAHFELKAGNWYICHHAYCCRADSLTVKEGERFQCEKDGIVKGFVIKEPEKYFTECSAPAPTEDEQKPAEVKPKFKIGDTLKKKNKDYTFVVDKIQGGFYLTSDEHFFPIEEQDSWELLLEQKPAEWDEYTKMNLDRAIQIIKKAKGTLQGYQSDDGIYECDKAIECLEHFLYRGLEIEKNAEWRDVELTFRGENVKVKRQFFRDDKGHEYSTTEQDEDVAWYALRAWCEKKGVSLYDLYPREEWSEEDEDFINMLILHFNYLINKGGDSVETYKSYIEKLKSFRPQPHTVSIKNATKFGNLEYERGVKDGIQYSENHRWKPSKEQIEALEDTIFFDKTVFRKKKLVSLLEELKKNDVI